MKLDFTINPIDKNTAYALVRSTHYSLVMPKLTKHYLGCFLKDRLVGILTLGWGTQPKGTINKMFTGLSSDSYYEIGKMCMLDDMPKNSESQMLSKAVNWIKKNCPEKLFLYTWADGIVGKAGYVYQSFNFLYGGYIWTSIYLSNKGEKIHPRTAQGKGGLCEENAKILGKEKIFWLTYDFMKMKGIKKIQGKQFRYIMPLNNKAKKLLKNSNMTWNIDYPKEKDLMWKEQIGKGKYKYLDNMPVIRGDVVEYNKKNTENFEATLNLFE